MAIAATLVNQGQHRLRYLLICNTTGTTTLTITTTGGATPDLLTDSAGTHGTIRQMAKAFTLGYGLFAAGALTQAQSRAIWLADNTGANLGNIRIQRAMQLLTKREVLATEWLIDANVDGGGHPTLTVTANGTGSCYLDIATPGTIGA